MVPRWFGGWRLMERPSASGIQCRSVANWACLGPVCEKVSCGLSRVPDKGVNAKAGRRGLEWLGGLLWSLLEGNKAFIGTVHRDGVVSVPCWSTGERHAELSSASQN